MKTSAEQEAEGVSGQIAPMIGGEKVPSKEEAQKVEEDKAQKELTLEQQFETVDDEDLEVLRRDMATLYGVPVSYIHLHVSPGSVVIRVTISPLSYPPFCSLLRKI